MLRTYKPLNNHPIFKYQTYLQELVCDVWCSASNEKACQELLSAELEVIYLDKKWVKESVDEIYDLCKPLSDLDRVRIIEAFSINNDIESLCESNREPIELTFLPDTLVDRIKKISIRFYSELITRTEKLDYYNKLIDNNDNYKFCPCCGLTPIESKETRYREDNDHYLPKADYPFAAVNFNNLPPLCSKCNKKCKSTKNPFKDGRTSFYPFKQLEEDFEISISMKKIPLEKEDITISFNNDPEKVETWNWLFEIKSRYNEEIRQFSKTELRTLGNRIKRNLERKHGMSYAQILTDAIEDYKIDCYDDRKFLKAPFLKEVLLNPNWINVYSTASH